MDSSDVISNFQSLIGQTQAQEQQAQQKADEPLAEWKKTLEMTTEGIGGGILHDKAISLIDKGGQYLLGKAKKLKLPSAELEKMLADYKDGGAEKMLKGLKTRGYDKVKDMLYKSNDDLATRNAKIKSLMDDLSQAKENPSQTEKQDKPQVQKDESIDEGGTKAKPPKISEEETPKPSTEIPKPKRVGNMKPIDDDDESVKQVLNRKKLLKRYKNLDEGDQREIDEKYRANKTSGKEGQSRDLSGGEIQKENNSKLDSLITDKEQNNLLQEAQSRIQEPIKGKPEELQIAESKTADSDLPSSKLALAKQKVIDEYKQSKGIKDPLKSEDIKFNTDTDLLDRPRGAYGMTKSKLQELQSKTRQQLQQKIQEQQETKPVPKPQDSIPQDVGESQSTQPKQPKEEPKEDEGDIDKDVEKQTEKKTIEKDAEKGGKEFAEIDAEGGGPEDPISDVVGAVVGLGTLLGGIFGARSRHASKPIALNPSYQIGA